MTCRLLPVLVALASLGAAPAALALTGATGLKITSQCSDGTITVDSAAGLHDAIAVSGNATNVEAPLGGHGVANVALACGDDAELTVTIPRDAGFHVTIDGFGGADWHVSEIVSYLDVTLRGSGDFEASALPGGIDVTSYDSGDVKLGSVGGALAFRGRGSGDLSVDQVTVGRLLVDTMGSSDVKVGGGRVGALVVHSRGSSDVTVGADAQTADLSTLGSGDIHVGNVAGNVTQSHAGSGTITVAGNGAGDHVTINWDQAAGHDVVVTDGAGHTGHIPAGVAVMISQIAEWVVGAALAVLLAGVLVVVVRRRRAPPGRTPEPRVAELAQLLARVGERASRLESCVTSKEFELHRGFRELGE